MKHLALALGFFLSGLGMGHAQSSNGPAELPPAGFEGREYTDSQGCVFLRSTFGGQVTWIPRYGPDRMPVCGETPTEIAAPAPEVAPEPAAEPAPTAAPVASAPVASAPVAAPRPAAAQPQPRRAAPAPRSRQRLPRADASGRHPDCPASAPYGQLVDTALGRPLVRCVTSPALFLDEYFDSSAPTTLAPRATSPATRVGRAVQVGSFAVPSNATRLRARLQNAGMPARIHRWRGLDVVTVGPFATPDSAHAALSSVRRMGFSDAFLR
ncbi:SPOR domain-containing protein [Natronohydrobacter thiooxidans]|uniref:SPOR domain-containing protein n=1 Tax=Natronohydrobacter thiooxidans TaxID=87172 RepID=UPI0008FF3B83|nr:SPOR domain-containing protein [Natronohydrobacter thiooxidans]